MHSVLSYCDNFCLKMEYSSAMEPQVIINDGQSSSDCEDLLYCKLCNKAFDKTLQYQSHMRYHKTEKKFSCIHCSKSFSQSNNLRTHIRIHTNERPFKCSECGKAFTQVTNLNNHMRLHTGERPYVCSVPGCYKAFAQVTNLNNHRRSHQKDMPYGCDLCDKIFSQQNHLILHRQIHHDRILKTECLSCLACGECFSEEKLLKKHVRESCKNEGIPDPSVKIRKLLKSESRKPCVFADCHRRFNDLSTLHDHLTKDHGILINPYQYKTKHCVSKINRNTSKVAKNSNSRNYMHSEKEAKNGEQSNK